VRVIAVGAEAVVVAVVTSVAKAAEAGH